jgi:hypothetical protein
MQTNVRSGFCLAKSPVLLTDKYRIRHCVHAIIFACAAWGMTQAAIAQPVAATTAAQSSVAATKTVQPEVVQSQAAQSAVMPTTTFQPTAAHSSVVQTKAVQTVAAQSGVAQTTTVQAAAPEPVAMKAAPPKPEKPWVTIDQPVKKKIVFIQFDVANISQVGDINNIYDGLPAELSRRIGTSKQYLSTSSRYSLPKSDEASQQQAMMQIAGETGAQFLISGLVLDAGTSHGIRHIEVELRVYDGFTGIPLLSRRFEDKTYGDKLVGINKPFGSSEFFDTDFGRAINRLINTAVKGIEVALAKVPFAAHIVRTNGNKVLIDAGANSLLKPGYKLAAYTNESHNPVNDLLGTKLGEVERPADMITLTDVQPQFSIGQLSHDASKIGVDAGNVARINYADLRYLAEHPIVILKKAKAPAVVKTEPVKTKPAIRVARHKTKRKPRHRRIRAKKRAPVTTVAKSNPCTQLAALRAACEKESPSTLKTGNSNILQRSL